MIFEREKISSYYLHNTSVENVFINEYVPDAPGVYVKVYLFALMYADIRVIINNTDIAKQLSLKVEDVLAAWTYWEEKGVIRKHYQDPSDRLHYKVEFVDLKEQIYGIGDRSKWKKDQPSKIKDLMDDKELKQMYSSIEQITGRLFQGKEPVAIFDWIGDYGISTDFIIYAYEYCKKQRNNTRLNYVGAVVKEWAERGLKTPEDIEAHLQDNDNRFYLYKRVMKALGFMRNPTEEERRIMDVWFDDLSIDIDGVLKACKKTSGISNPNINYVNTVLTSNRKKTIATGNDDGSDNRISRVIKSYEMDRAANEADALKRREEVYKLVPRIYEIEEEIREISMEISRTMLSGGTAAKTKIRSLRNNHEELTNERSYLLTDNNFQINYLDTWYTCPLCKDTGILDSGIRCSCFADKLSGLEKKI